jgi:hypothetical protein
MNNETVNHTTDKASELPINLIISLSITTEKNKSGHVFFHLIHTQTSSSFASAQYTQPMSLLTSALQTSPDFMGDAGFLCD